MTDAALPLSLSEIEILTKNIDIFDAQDFQDLCALRIKLPVDLDELLSIDPFSADYRGRVMTVFKEIRGRADYVPERDEVVAPTHPGIKNLFMDVSPWNLKDTAYFSEFLYSWGQIFRLLDLKNCGSVLEYGPGSGQLLLMLARLNVDAYGVDINQTSLDAIAAQADYLSLKVRLERNLFGKGFEGKKFDRILFFESFHHELQFFELVEALKERLVPGGFIVFCGEPIAAFEFDAIPYPWGPRMDGASYYCMRRYGWLELGFTHAFFTEMLRRAGYDVDFHPFSGCGRAMAYVARPGSGVLRQLDAVGDPPPTPPARRSLLQRASGLFGRG